MSHHSDHCAQYVSIRKSERLAEAGIESPALENNESVELPAREWVS